MTIDTTADLEIGATLRELGYVADCRWAWDNYANVVVSLSRRIRLRRLCEIGGGRNPLLTPAEVTALEVDYTVNDISANELALAPTEFRTACFDVAGELSGEPVAQSFELIFSRMVFEH